MKQKKLNLKAKAKRALSKIITKFTKTFKELLDFAEYL